jgi:hypothetical protein
VTGSEIASLVEAVLRKKTAEDLWTLMLHEDPVYGKIPEELRREAVLRAAQFGRQASEGVVARFGTMDPIAIVRGLEVRLAWSDEAHLFGKIVRTSTYAHRTRTITIYTRSVDEMNRALAAPDLVSLLEVRDIGPVYIAHELFHHLEEESLGRAANLLRIVTFKLGPFEMRSGIGQMSEIAADAFAQKLLGLRAAPRLLDYVTVWIHNPDAGRRRLGALVNA